MKKLITALYFLLIINVFTIGINVKSASPIEIRCNSSVIVGNNMAVTIKTNGPIGKYSLTTSDASILSGGTGSAANGFNSPGQSATFSFKANKAGTATIIFTPVDMTDINDTSQLYSKVQKITITVKNKPIVVLSKDSSLSSLTVGVGTLSPEFNKDIKEYSVILPPETTTLEIGATPNHGGATIVGNGTKEVTDGDNKLEIVVTAENGTTSTYVINAKVEEYNPIEVTVNNKKYTVVRKKSQLQAPANYTETTVKINEEDIPAFKSEITKYTLVALKDENGNQNFYVYDNGNYTLYREFGFNKINLFPLELNNKDIPEGYKKSTITYNDQTIVAYKYKEKSKYSLIYGMNLETGETNIYMYDSKEDTIQIYNVEEIKELNNKLDLYFYIILGLSGLSILLFIILIIVSVKKGNKKNKKEIIDDSTLEKQEDIFEMKRKELSKKELRKKAKKDKKALKKEKSFSMEDSGF